MLTLRRLLRLTRLDREEGQVLPIFAGGILAMLLMTAVVVDGGNLFQNRQSLQNAADASAVAAALYIAGHTNCQGAASVGACAGIYAGLNGASDGSALVPCAATVNITKPPPDTPSCYVYPYTNTEEVEVWLTRKTSNFFGKLLGFATSTESARAVGTLAGGPPPPITFAALENTAACDNHTLLIKLGGVLTVNQSIYVNSCNVPQDAFDVFNGGKIIAPSIIVHGGWETHDGSTVWTTGAGQTWPQVTQCPDVNSSAYYNNGTKMFQMPPPNGCPVDGVNALPDPFLAFPPVPDFGAGNVGAPVNITKISRGLNGDGANVARVVTASAHGLAVGNTVTISGVGTFGGGDFDGAYTVASVPNATTFTYANTGGTVPVITQRQMAGGVVTLTTNAPTTLSTSGPDKSVTVSGINNFFNFAGSVTGPSSSGAMSSFSYPSAYADPVSQKGLQQGTATLKLATTANLAVGNTMTVTGVDPLLNTPANTPVTLTAVGGGTVSYADPKTTQYSISSASITNGTAASAKVNITTSAVNHIFTNDGITVSGSGDSRINGSQTSTSNGGNTTLTYNIGGVVANTTNKSAALGKVILTAATPPFSSGDTVNVSTGSLAYGSGNVALTGVGANTFSYAAPTISSTAWTENASKVVTVTTGAGATVNGLRAGDTVNISGFDNGHNCLNVGNTAVLNSPAPTNTTFAFQAACTVAGGPGMNPKVALVTAASSSAPGTAFLVTGSSSASCSNCITAPAYIAANTSATGSATLWDSSSVASSGTFTPVWMSTFGVVSQDFPGSPGIPFPKEIPNGTVTLQPGTYYGGICIGAASGSNCVGTTNCAAAGGSTTTIQPYSPVIKLKAPVSDNFDNNTPPGTGTILVDQAGISNGDLIAIDDEEMSVTGPPVNNGDGTFTIPVSREANGTEDGPHTAGTQVFHVVTTKNATPYNPAVTVNAPMPPPGGLTAAQTTVPIQWGGPNMNTNPVQVNDVIQIGSEDMLVISETPAAMGKSTLTVTRGYFTTTAATHPNNAAVLNASSGSTATVTLSPGVYIMAGGGFSVCGAASVSAPQGVMIYNTNDPSSPNGNGALGQVDINTAGNVHLSPMTTGIYAGMTIFQDRSLTLAGGACGGKSGNPAQWDIALQSAAPLPVSGELGSISGTIYDPSLGADFGDSMSGTTNLAVISSCIYINGANATFNYNPGNGQLFGVGATLGE